MCSSRRAPRVGLMPGHRLVQQQHRGLGHQGACELEQLALPAREHSRVLVRELAELEDLEQLLGALAHLALPRPRGSRSQHEVVEVLAGLVRSGQHHVVDHRHLRERLGDLEGAHHAEPRDHVGWPAHDLLALEQDRSALGPVEAGDHVEERGLPGSVRPDQRRHRVLLDVEAGTVHGRDPAEVLDQSLDLENGPSPRDANPRQRGCSPQASARPVIAQSPSTISSFFPNIPCGRKAISRIRTSPTIMKRTAASRSALMGRSMKRVPSRIVHMMIAPAATPQ